MFPLTSWPSVVWVWQPLPRMLCDPDPGILCSGSHGLCKVCIGEEGTVRRADDAGAPWWPAVFLGCRAPAIDHGTGYWAVQLTCAGCRCLIQSAQRQPRMGTVLMRRDEQVRVSLVDQWHIRVCLVCFFVVLQTISVQTQGAGDVAVCVRGRDRPWWRRRAD